MNDIIMQNDHLEQPLGGVCGDCVSWHMVDAHTILIEGVGKMDDYGPQMLPPWHMHEITTVEVGEGVTGIGTCAFSRTLTKAHISHLSTPALFAYTIEFLFMWDDDLLAILSKED